MSTKRSIPLCIILSLVTCGIYGLYWFVVLTDEVNAASGSDSPSGIVSLLLFLITCNIYGYFWAYKMGTNVTTIKQQYGGTVEDYNPILYLILSLFGLQIVVWALMQDALNQGALNA